MIVAREKTSSYGFFEETLQPKKTRRRKTVFKTEKIVLTGFVLAIFLVGVFITHYCSQLFTLGYKIHRLNNELAVLRVENQGLDEQIRHLINLDTIEYVATNKLNMVKPDTNNYLLVTVADTSSYDATIMLETEAETDQPDTAPPEKGKNILIKTFDELVTRFDNRGG